MATKPRNPVARSPLLRKGGAHGKSRSGERMKTRNALRRELEQRTGTAPGKAPESE